MKLLSFGLLIVDVPEYAPTNLPNVEQEQMSILRKELLKKLDSDGLMFVEL